MSRSEAGRGQERAKIDGRLRKQQESSRHPAASHPTAQYNIISRELITKEQPQWSLEKAGHASESEFARTPPPPRAQTIMIHEVQRRRSWGPAMEQDLFEASE